MLLGLCVFVWMKVFAKLGKKVQMMMNEMEDELVPDSAGLSSLTSSMSLHLMPFPEYPVGHFPHFQVPSGKLVHLAPAKQGLDRHPSGDRTTGCQDPTGTL